jgi:hypothetical protein
LIHGSQRRIRNGDLKTINLCRKNDGIGLKVGSIDGPLLSTEQLGHNQDRERTDDDNQLYSFGLKAYYISLIDEAAKRRGNDDERTGR